ncbi:hypothetical protein RvY_05099 [Ramazzottius varieornatus]|uniref:Uncharacterized protein n=1 Tax=Ramazzottius varieornatus TaxID=947166 RepID=A0A1D1UZM6_RAMVA|nr:hypothetical protein RvY_05099 [Ramazzottius varieornatus]
MKDAVPSITEFSSAAVFFCRYIMSFVRRILLHVQPLLKASQHRPASSVLCQSERSRPSASANQSEVSTVATSWHAAPLTSRSCIEVNGKDAADFLQGLITNDIHLLDGCTEGGPQCIYSMMLNHQGRVIYDLLVFSVVPNEYLLECDASLKDKLMKHLKLYKLRKDLTVSSSTQNVFSVYPDINDASFQTKAGNSEARFPDSGRMFRDPRLGLLGFRQLRETANNENNSGGITTSDELSYRRFRLKLGVPEGSQELPPGECFPMESNLDFMAGVNFDKGCYLGQELTARTHHTGVIRKRLMPIQIEGIGEDKVDVIQRDTPIVNSSKKNVGKLRGHVGSSGVALMRVQEALAAESLMCDFNGQRVDVKVQRPSWWPT